MAIYKINPAAIGAQLGTTAAAKAAIAVAQTMSPKLVQDVQRVLSVGNILGNTIGLKTGISIIDSLFSLNGDPTGQASSLLGGLTSKQARVIHDQVKALRVAKKNLFFVRITDGNPPLDDYPTRAPGAPPSLGELISSKIGAAAGTVVAGISGAVGSIAGASAGDFVNGMMGGGPVNGALGVGGGSASRSISAIAINSFDLLCMDVSYGPSIISDHVQVGSGFIDRPTGRNPIEMSITTMDDEAGSLKRWFNGKLDQVTHLDGTFGLPKDYIVGIEIVHAIPSDQVPGYKLAYSKTMKMRPQSIQMDLSRRDQAVAEHQLVFSQFDSWK